MRISAEPDYIDCAGCGVEFRGFSVRFGRAGSPDSGDAICPSCMDDHMAAILGVPQGSAAALKWRWPEGEAPSDEEVLRVCREKAPRKASTMPGTIGRRIMEALG